MLPIRPLTIGVKAEAEAMEPRPAESALIEVVLLHSLVLLLYLEQKDHLVCWEQSKPEGARCWA